MPPRSNQQPTRALGALVRRRREEQGLSQRDLAERAGLAHSNIGRLETGFYSRPQPELLQRVARVLGIDVEDLYAEAYPGASLPQLPQYLRRAHGLPEEAATEVQAYFARLREKYGVDDDPGGRHGQ